MTTEQELLKQIWESDGKVSLQLIAKRLGIRTDYIGYLCKELIRKGLIKKFKRDRYKVTAKGRKSSARKPPLRQRIAYKRRARKKIRKKRKGGKKKVSKKSQKRISKKPKRKRKSTIKRVIKKIKREILTPLSLKDEKIFSAEQTLTDRDSNRDSKIAEESKSIIPSKKRKEPNKLLKIFKGLFGVKKE